jgi:hypothetical protein
MSFVAQLGKISIIFSATDSLDGDNDPAPDFAPDGTATGGVSMSDAPEWKKDGLCSHKKKGVKKLRPNH